MITDRMTPAEVAREAIADLPAMWNKMKEPIERLKRRSRVDKRVQGKELLEPYRSHNGNNWLVAMRPFKKVINIAPFVWYRGQDLMYRAARIHDDGLCFHISHHVLEQYFARFNKEMDGLARLKEFVKENMDMALVSNRADPNELRCGIRHGMLTGTWAVKDQVVQLTTFVDHGHLYPDQLTMMDQLDDDRANMMRGTRRQPPGYKKPWEKGKE